MLGPYIAAMVFGGVLLALSLFAGGGEDGAGGGADAGEVEADAGGDAGAHHDHEAHAHAGAVGGFLSTFASLRFWTFFFAFGGGTGLALTATGLSPAVTAIAAATMGAVSGGFAAWTFRFLWRNPLTSSLSSEDWIGRTGRVIVPLSGERPGKIRIELDQEVKDLVALAAGASEGEMGVGDEVLIVSMADGVAKVTPNRPAGKQARPLATETKH